MSGVIHNTVAIKAVTSDFPKAVGDVGHLNEKIKVTGSNATNASRGFSDMQKGLGGFVGAYAGAAATFFALQQAYSALKESAKLEQSIQGTRLLASEIGDSGDMLLASIKNITKGQLSLRDAAESANLALSAGFSGEQVERLTTIATKASRALGRDLGDSFIRLARGAAKLEPELLDELGIFTRIEPAVQSYAIQMGKSEKFLTNFERRQAFVNAVIEEGGRKFSNIGTSGDTAASSIERLAASLFDLGQKLTGLLAGTFAPFADFLSGSLANSFAAIGLIASLAFSKAGQVLGGFIKGNVDKLTNFNDYAQSKIRDLSGTSKEVSQKLAIQSTGYDTAMPGATKDKSAYVSSLAKNMVLKDSELKELKKLAQINVTNQMVEIAKIASKSKLDLDSVNNAIGSFRFYDDNNQPKSFKDFREHMTTASVNQPKTNDKSLSKVTRAGFSAIQDMQVIKTVNEHVDSQGKIGAVFSGTSTAISKTVSAVGKFIEGLARVGGIVGITVAIIELLGSAFLKAFGIEHVFDKFLEGLIGITSRFFGLTKQAEELKKSVAGIADFSLNKRFKEANLSEVTKFDVKDTFLGISYDAPKDQQDFTKKLSEVALSSYKAAVGKNSPATNFLTNLALLNPLTLQAGILSKVVSPEGKFDKAKFGESIDSMITKVKENYNPATYEAEVATMAFVKSLEDLKETGIHVYDVMQQLATQTGLTTSAFMKGLTPTDFNRSKLETKYNFKDMAGKDSSLSIYTEDYLKAREKEIKRQNTRIDITEGGFKGSTFQPIVRTEVFDEKAFNEDKRSLRAVQQVKLESVSLKARQNDLSKYLESEDISAEGLARLDTGIENVRKKITDLKGTLDQGPNSPNFVQKFIGDYSLTEAERLLEKLEKQRTLQKAVSDKAQGLLSMEVQIAKTFQSEINAAQEFQGMINESGKLATKQTEVRANLMSKISNIMDSADFSGKGKNRGIEGIRNRLGSQGRNVLRGTLVSISQEIEKITDENKKNLINSDLEVYNSKSAIDKELHTSAIQNAEIKIKIIQTELEYENKLKDIASQRIDIQSKAAQAAIQAQITLLGITKEMLSLNLQISNEESKSRLLAREKSDIEKNSKLQFTSDLSGEFSNLFTDSQKRQIKIDLDVSKLESLENTTRENIDSNNKAAEVKKQQLEIESQIAKKQYELAAIQAGAESKKIAIEIGKIKASESALVKEAAEKKIIFESQQNLAKLAHADNKEKIAADRKLKDLEFDIIDRRIDILVKEGEILSEHAKVLGKIIGADMATFEVHGEQSLRSKTTAHMDIDQLKEYYSKVATDSAKEILPKVEGIRAGQAKLRSNSEDSTANQYKLNDKELQQKSKVIAEEEAAYNLSVTRQKEINKGLIANLELEQKAAGAAAGAAYQAYQATLQKIDLEKVQNTIVTDNLNKQAANQLLEARLAVENQKRLAKLADTPLFKFADDFNKILKEDMTKGLKDLNEAFVEGTLTMDNFKQGLHDWARGLVKNVQQALFERTVIEPITNYVQEQVGGVLKGWFDIDGPKKIEGALVQTASGLALRTTTDSVAGLAKGTDYSSQTTKYESIDDLIKADETQQALGKTQSVFGEFTSSFSNYGIALGGTFASILASGGDFKSALVGIFASLFAQIARNLATSGSLSGVPGGFGSGIGEALSGAGSWIGNLFSSGTGSYLDYGGVAGAAWSSGGRVTRMASGGMAGRDTVPAWLEPGEFVMRRSAVDSIGLQNLNQMNNHGNQNVQPTINIHNNGTPQEVQGKPQVNYNMNKMVVDIVLKDYANNGPMRQSLRGGNF